MRSWTASRSIAPSSVELASSNASPVMIETTEERAERTGHPHPVSQADVGVRQDHRGTAPEDPRASCRGPFDGSPRRRLGFARATGRSCGWSTSGRSTSRGGRPTEPRTAPRLAIGSRRRSRVVQAHVERHEDVFLAGEVVVERGLGEAEWFGDLPQRRLVVALLDEQVEGDIEDPLPGGLGLRSVLGIGTVRSLLAWLVIPILIDYLTAGKLCRLPCGR